MDKRNRIKLVRTIEIIQVTADCWKQVDIHTVIIFFFQFSHLPNRLNHRFNFLKS